jgi:hypothetical protein
MENMSNIVNDSSAFHIGLAFIVVLSAGLLLNPIFICNSIRKIKQIQDK